MSWVLPFACPSICINARARVRAAEISNHVILGKPMAFVQQETERVHDVGGEEPERGVKRNASLITIYLVNPVFFLNKNVRGKA